MRSIDVSPSDQSLWRADRRAAAPRSVEAARRPRARADRPGTPGTLARQRLLDDREGRVADALAPAQGCGIPQLLVGQPLDRVGGRPERLRLVARRPLALEQRRDLGERVVRVHAAQRAVRARHGQATFAPLDDHRRARQRDGTPSRTGSTSTPIAGGEQRDAVRDDRGEQRRAQERGLHHRRAHRVVLIELGVGLAARCLERVVVDDVGLDVGGERAGHLLALERHRVVGDRDVLGRQLVRHADPRDDADDDQQDAADDAEDADRLDQSELLRGRLDGVGGVGAVSSVMASSSDRECAAASRYRRRGDAGGRGAVHRAP